MTDHTTGNPATPGTDDGKIDLLDLIDNRPLRGTQIGVTALCSTALFIDGYDIQIMAINVTTLESALGLPQASFGWALSAVVIGITLGAATIGWLGDRFGRRNMLIASMIAIGVATCATATATTPTEFFIWRLLTGLALGAGIPSCAALTSEYAPVANRSMLMGLMNLASPIGASAAGFVAPLILANYGWQGTFIIGGVAPFIIAGLALLIPESLKFLLIRKPDDPRIERYIRRLAPEIDPASVRISAPLDSPKLSPLTLIAQPFRNRTLLLWAMLILNFFNLYMLISWLPALLQNMGWALDDASRGAVLIQVGGIVGGLLMARCMDRGLTRPALAVGFSLCAVCLCAFMLVTGQTTWVILLLLVGAGVSGSQLSLNALSAAYYPPAIKATGVSSALVIGHIGAIAAPVVGARLIELQFAPTHILALLAIPAIACALGVLLMRNEWQAH